MSDDAVKEPLAATGNLPKLSVLAHLLKGPSSCLSSLSSTLAILHDLFRYWDVKHNSCISLAEGWKGRACIDLGGPPTFPDDENTVFVKRNLLGGLFRELSSDLHTQNGFGRFLESFYSRIFWHVLHVITVLIKLVPFAVHKAGTIPITDVKEVKWVPCIVQSRPECLWGGFEWQGLLLEARGAAGDMCCALIKPLEVVHLQPKKTYILFDWKS